ncbi:hypothetical protein [Oleispirillum naphthae]|uniref:PepSY domain-containing protein n=1 Tax=Oleispirillum naphthae TaxID=2838853 RepID=UPI0030825172
MIKGACGALVGLAMLGASAAGAAERETAALPDGQDVMPLSAILDRVMPVIDGEVGGAKLLRTGGQWVYVITFYDETGAPRELIVDATSAAIVSISSAR